MALDAAEFMRLQFLEVNSSSWPGYTLFSPHSIRKPFHWLNFLWEVFLGHLPSVKVDTGPANWFSDIHGCSFINKKLSPE